eukprot:scaffold1_cov108-Cylindrotheca_fusiformis.AAC.10
MTVPKLEPRQQANSCGWSFREMITLVALLYLMFIMLTNDDVMIEKATFMAGGLSTTKMWANDMALATNEFAMAVINPGLGGGGGGDHYFMKGRTVQVVKPTMKKLKDKEYMMKYRATDAEYDEMETAQTVDQSPISSRIPDTQNSWILPDKLEKPTRNHDSILFDVESSRRQLLLQLFGRGTPYLQWMDLLTGAQKQLEVPKTKDPSGFPLSNLHHVSSVVVDSLSEPSHKEVWLPCGFHELESGTSVSSEYARIVNLQTMQVEVGPKLSMSRGACVAKAIHLKGPDQPAHICVFGGSYGEHDEGAFLPYTACYDRVEEEWHHPFGRLPTGLDHGNLVHVPSLVCGGNDPERLLLFNYRTQVEGLLSSKILAFNLPMDGWSSEDSIEMDVETAGNWYTYADIEFELGDEVNTPRDSSGVALANRGKKVLNFGGIKIRGNKQRKYSSVRSFDVCEKTWSIVGDMGLRVNGIATSVSSKGNFAVSCGGHLPAIGDNNNPWNPTSERRCPYRHKRRANSRNALAGEMVRADGVLKAIESETAPHTDITENHHREAQMFVKKLAADLSVR